MLRNSILRTLMALLLAFAGSQLTESSTLYGAEFFCASGDVTCLIASINEANSTPEEDTVNLAAGIYTLVGADNNIDGPTGLPSITSNITINGAGADVTIIERDANLSNLPLDAQFRILHVASTGTLTLNEVTIRGGFRISDDPLSPFHIFFGGGIANRGTLGVNNSIISNNDARQGGGIWNSDGTVAITSSIISGNTAGTFGGVGGGGIFSSGGGTVTITDSSVSRNRVLDGRGGGIQNSGTMSITNSTISSNIGAESTGAGIDNGGTMTIMNSTVSGNILSLFLGSGIFNDGTLTVINSTISGNRNGGGIFSSFGQGSVELKNTILALNTFGLPPPSPLSVTDDCPGFGPLTSLGNNLIGDPTRCNINLQSTDLTGDPGLGAFIDDGAPGHGRFPLLPGSPTINAASDAACPTADQLTRRGPCDIVAVEFYPVVNDLVALTKLSTDFYSAQVPNGPAGIFHITAEFTNTSNQAIANPFAEVVDLTGGNLLLNANGGAGGVGARLPFADSATTLFQPGASSTFEFLIGLQNQEPFTFLVNMFGDPQTLNLSVSKR